MDLSEPSLDRYRADSQSPPPFSLSSRRCRADGRPAGSPLAARVTAGVVRLRRHHGPVAERVSPAASRAARLWSRAPHRVELGAVAGGRPAFALKLALVVSAREPAETMREKEPVAWRATARCSTSSKPPARPRLPTAAPSAHGLAARRSCPRARQPSPPARPGDGATVRLLHSASACGRRATAPGTIAPRRGYLAQVGDDLGERFAVAEAFLARGQRVAGAGVDVHGLVPFNGWCSARGSRANAPRVGLLRLWTRGFMRQTHAPDRAMGHDSGRTGADRHLDGPGAARGLSAHERGSQAWRSWPWLGAELLTQLPASAPGGVLDAAGGHPHPLAGLVMGVAGGGERDHVTVALGQLGQGAQQFGGVQP